MVKGQKKVRRLGWALYSWKGPLAGEGERPTTESFIFPLDKARRKKDGRDKLCVMPPPKSPQTPQKPRKVGGKGRRGRGGATINIYLSQY